ncbi:hypothetical protein [Bosea sp. (in: a-proteobacteria)]|jgi:hypothetical protein|uniref:hypothetical protein n=1 Tax=Bosea sp. (in: a-proteobacteria) TaxID=1871050 RepID=UPI003566535F
MRKTSEPATAPELSQSQSEPALSHPQPEAPSMRKLKYTGPIDTLELHDKDGETVFSKHLHPGKTYKLPEGEFQIVETMLGRGLFVDPKTETETSPGNDTSP